MKINVLGVEFDNMTMREALDKAEEILGNDQETAEYIVTPNPEIVWLCRRDEKLKGIINKAALCLPDGVGITYGAKILGRPLKQRLPGIDFISELFQIVSQRGYSVFLFGAKPGVAEKAAENLEKKYPGINICGTADGYFQDDAPVIKKINSLSPDLLLVCLGAPKQEYWMADNAGQVNAKLMAGLGGSLDVFAGTVERAPEKWRRHGLEWLYRLKKEPKRIKRMIKLPLFIFAVIWQRLRGK